ncbi:MAG: MarR family winged helix-turn-helix transcriptional regulator [Mesorhizobium sp.]
MTGESNLLKLVDADAPADGYRLDEQVGFLLRRAHQRHVAIFAAAIPELTPPQFAALAKLGEVGDCSQNQLGQLVAMDSATIKGVIDRLKGRGLVSLAPDTVDKRRIVVSLTNDGREVLASLKTTAADISRETLQPLSEREAETFVKLLGKLG